KPSMTNPPSKAIGTCFACIRDTRDSAKVTVAPMTNRKKYKRSGMSSQGLASCGDVENSQSSETASRPSCTKRPKRRVNRAMTMNSGAAASSMNRLQVAHIRSGEARARLFLKTSHNETAIKEGATIEPQYVTAKNATSATAMVGYSRMKRFNKNEQPTAGHG